MALIVQMDIVQLDVNIDRVLEELTFNTQKERNLYQR